MTVSATNRVSVLGEGRARARGQARRHHPGALAQVRDLRSQNVGLLEQARRLGLSTNTVKRYDRASEPQRLQIDASAWCSPLCPTSPRPRRTAAR